MFKNYFVDACMNTCTEIFNEHKYLNIDTCTNC